jgi:hypothetical protein
LGAELFRALRHGQDEIGADNELRFLELFQAAVYYLGLPMEEQHS